MAEVLLKSAYEVARDQRLLRNRRVMEELGLLTTEKETDEGSAEPIKAEDKKTKKPKVKLEPTRRSKRVQRLSPEGTPLEDENAIDDEDVEQEEEHEDRRMQLKIERLKALHKERKTTYKNPTATYEHTWMRIRTMSDKMLERRITVIERALGRDCLVKMRMFAEVLLLAHKYDLAKKAQDALERLLGLGLE